jgi:hypothetical protein
MPESKPAYNVVHRSPAMITLSTRVTVPTPVLFRDLEGEAVILETESGRYYGLNEIGTRIWSLLQIHEEIGPAYNQLLEEYTVGPDQLCKDFLQFVELLVARRLLKVQSS